MMMIMMISRMTPPRQFPLERPQRIYHTRFKIVYSNCNIWNIVNGRYIRIRMIVRHRNRYWIQEHDIYYSNYYNPMSLPNSMVVYRRGRKPMSITPLLVLIIRCMMIIIPTTAAAAAAAAVLPKRHSHHRRTSVPTCLAFHPSLLLLLLLLAKVIKIQVTTTTTM